MSEVELYLIGKGDKCTIYSLQFLRDSETEFEKFVGRFVNNAEYNESYTTIIAFINRIFKLGAQERFFRMEGKIKDSVVALPTTKSKLRLYCLRMSDKILILGNGGIKKGQRYNEDPELNGYVLTLQKFEKILKEGIENGSVTVTESTIETDNIFDI